jgi:type I restriction enzyme S subunit
MSEYQLPRGWELRNLGGVDGFAPAAVFLDNLRVPVNEKERAKRPGPYPYYGANGQQGWIDDFIFDEELILLAEDGGFFFSATKPASYRVSGKCWVNNHAHVLRPQADVHPDWLNACLAFADYTPYIPEPIRPKLNQKNAKKIPIPVPPIDEQRRIVARIEALTRRAEEARKLRRKAVAQIATLLHSAIQSILNGAEEFIEKPIGQICSMKTGKTPPTKQSEYFDGDVLFVCPSDLGENLCIASSARKLAQKAISDGKATLFKAGTVLLVGIGSTVGKVGIADCDLCTNQQITGLIFADSILPEYAAWYLSTQKDVIRTAAAGTGVPIINQQGIAQLTIKYPNSTTQQQAIVNKLNDLQEKAEEITKLQNDVDEELAKFQSALLAKASRGEL